MSRVWRLLIGLQVSLLVFALVAPAGTMAADPSDPPASPPPSEEPSAPPPPDPSPTAEPSAEPTAEPPADPTPAPTSEPTAEPTAEPTPAPTPEPTSPFIVTFAAGVSSATQAAAIAAAGATSTDTIAALRMQAVNAGPSALAALNADSRVARVEPDRSRATEADPSDPGYASQWALPKIGWDSVYGSSIAGSATVAVLDTGVDASQPDLAGKVVGGTSLVGSAATSDPNGHGTAMAGIIAAAADNGIGIAGVGYDGVSIMPVSVLGADGTGRDSDVIEGLVWATDHGADVALMAFSASGYSAALQAAVDYAWSHGVVLVAATGNDGSSSAAFPAGDRGVVGVSNTDESDALNASSNYGADTFLAAPGTGILTLAAGGGTTTITGTSASAAHVAAAAALLRAADGSLSNGAIVGRLARTADAAGTAAETGNGRLNLARAFADASTGSVQPAGAAPVGDGGPFVGPYVAAGSGVVAITVRDSVTNAVIVGATVSCTANCTGSGNSGTTNGSGVAQFTVNYSGNSETVTLQATATGFSANSGSLLVANTNNAASPATLTLLLTPNNIAPVVTPPANNTATEGSSKSFALGSFTDAGPSPWAVDVDWGDGSAHTTFSLASAGTITAQNHTFADGSATRTVTVKVTDTGGTGTSGQATFTVTVSNVAPTLSPTGAAHVNEGSTYSLTLGAVTDPGTDTVSSYIVHWGDGNTDTYATNVGAKTHTYADGPATRTITVDLVDEDGTFLAAGTTSVIVDNVAPTTTFVSGDTTVDESDVTLHTYVFSIFDPGADTIIGTGTSCGVGATQVGLTTSTNTSLTFTCKFPNGASDPQLQANATDSDVATGPFTFQPVHVNNVAPVAANDTGSTNEDSNLVVAAPGVLGNDTDVAADSLSVGEVNGSAADVGVPVTLGSGAKVTLNADGSYTYNPNGVFENLDTGESTTDSFTYKASDGTALSTSATVTITITGVNDPPVAASASASVGHLSAAGVNVTLSATDVDGEALTFSIVASPSDGALGAIGSVTCDGLTPSTCTAVVHYAPNSPSGDFVGTDTFIYRASDGVAFSNTATATLTLTNAAPTATVALTPTAPMTNQTLTATVTSSDADGDALTYTFVWKNGSTIVQTTSGTSSLTDTLDLSVAGNGDKGDTITVEVTPNDGHVNGATASDSETVANSNPMIDSVTALPVSVNEGSGTAVSAVAHDDDGDPITYEFNCTADLDPTYEVGPQLTNGTTCTYDDGPDGHLAGVRVSDGTGFDSATTPVAVLSVAPTGTFSASTPVDEGSASTLGWTGVTDPSSADTSAGFHYSFACTSNLADLNFNYATAGTGSTHPCTFDDNGSYGVEGAVIDKDNASSTSGGSVTVINVAPTAALANDGPIDEGSSATVSFSNPLDPSTADTTAGFRYSFACTGGSAALATTYAAAGASTSTSCPFDDNGSFTVYGRIFDKDDGYSTYSTTVVVNNVDPTATLGNNGPVAEGSPATVSFTSQSDPSSADTTAGFHYAYSCSNGDLSSATYAGSGTSASTTCTYDDGPSSHTVKARIIDKDGGFNEYTTSVSVLNVAPTPHITGAPASSPEGTAISLGSSVTDPSAADTLAGLTRAWSVTKDGSPFASGGNVSTFSFTPDDNGTYVVTLDATDKDGGAGSTTVTISVTNVAPASVNLTLSATTINENQSTSLSGAFTDPGTLDTHTVVVNWGDGSANTTIDLAAGVLTFGPTSHQYLDDDPTGTSSDIKTISVTVTDDDGGSGSGSTTVTVNNVAPSSVSATPSPSTINEGDSTSMSGSFVDPGTQDTHKVTISWGDGSPNTVVDLAAGVLTFSGVMHTYADDNPTNTPSDSYSISVTVKDDDNGSGSGTTSVTVNNVAPTITGFTGTTSFAGPLVFVPSTFTTTFTDPGTDTFRAEFNWGDGSPVQTVTPFHSGDKVDHLYTTAICGRTVTVKVIDDDTGSVQGTTTVNIGTGGFLAPMTNQPVTNKLKNGQVLPVKIQLSDCTGAGVNGLTPAIRLVAGDQTSVLDDTATTITPPSVSGADTDGWMRPSNPNGTYLYNMQVNIPLNTDYTVVIYPFATATPFNLNGGYTLRHVIQATK